MDPKVKEAEVQEPKPEIKTETKQPAAPVVDMDALTKSLTTAISQNVGPIAESVKALESRLAAIEAQPANDLGVQTPGGTMKGAPYISKTGLGDTEAKAWAAFYKRNDPGGVMHLQGPDGGFVIKASNDTDMNIGTDADGGYAVPTGHYNGIITKMDELALYGPLGVELIPGAGTTVNVPVDNESDGEFVSTAETTAFDRDAPALGTVAMTLGKYTKKVEMSIELMDDETSRLMDYVNRRVGYGLAKTHNNLLVTEALANGTAGLTLDGSAAITAAEVPELMYKLKGEYADQAVWVMDRLTEGYLMGLTGDNFQFAQTPPANMALGPNASGRNRLFNAPVFNTSKMPDIGAGNKPLLFGNFTFMGMRLKPELTVLRDPYSKASNGQVLFHYFFRTVYKVMIAEAIQYATHPTA